MLSVIIPTLNAASTLANTLRPLYCPLVGEVIVADGGSEDGTQALAAALGASVVTAGLGRGGQLARGAALARYDWLLFLHADTKLEAGWDADAHAFMADAENTGRAAIFRFALDDDTQAARRLERIVAWRVKTFGLAYGDQGLLLARAFYLSLGGFKPLPIMEDVDLIRRIGKGRLTQLKIRAVTSAERWRAEGWLQRSARNVICLVCYFAGLPPGLIARLYAPGSKPKASVRG